MPKTLPSSFIPEKNKLASPNATVLLCELTPVGESTLYFVRNTENLTSNEQEYQAIWFEIDAVKENSKGDLPAVTLRVNNVTRAVEALLQDYDGLVDAQVTIKAVNVANPDDTMLALDFDVMHSESDEKWVYLSLGAPSPLRRIFPPDRYQAEYCAWIPGGVECGVPAAAGACNRTASDCRTVYKNMARFGGDFGLTNPNVRLV